MNRETLDILWQIAALIHQLPADAPTVSIAVAERGKPCPALDALREAGGEAQTHVYEADAHGPAHAIDSVWIEVDGVEFTAQASRDLTDAEREEMRVKALDRVAKLRVMGDHIALDVRRGADLHAVAVAAANLAARENCPVRFTFNDTPIEVLPEESARSVLQQYDRKRSG